MNIPQSDNLSTNILGKVFKNTVATYKYFWFISILQIYTKKDCARIDIWDILVRMVANAWYPIQYFRLSFGKSDSLYNIVSTIQKELNIPVDIKYDNLISILTENLSEKIVRDNIIILMQNVPYRFLRPWINTSDNNEMVNRSQIYEGECLYSLHKNDNDFYIDLNPIWFSYLKKNSQILIDFAYWNLTLFLQVRNPNVPAIPSKLIRPEIRNSLTKQHKYWDLVFELGGPIHCIYTGRELSVGDYDLDHFIPWSFVSHDLLWNLIPSDGSINSSKSDKLPDLDYYLPKLSELQHKSLQLVINCHKETKILEDFVTLGYTPNELACMSKESFFELYARTFNPINQIALNMGFETWQYKK